MEHCAAPPVGMASQTAKRRKRWLMKTEDKIFPMKPAARAERTVAVISGMIRPAPRKQVARAEKPHTGADATVRKTHKTILNKKKAAKGSLFYL